MAIIDKGGALIECHFDRENDQKCLNRRTYGGVALMKVANLAGSTVL